MDAAEGPARSPGAEHAPYDPHLRIDTPENVIFDYEVAGIGSRFLAALVDTLLIVILEIVVNFTLFLLLSQLIAPTVDWGERLGMWLIAIFGLISFAFLWGYYVFFEMVWNGQSPGKRWVGLRVIRSDGTPITLVESLIRNLIRLFDFLPSSYAIGVVTMFIDAKSRRLGDLAAGTLVVRDRGAVTLESLAKRARHSPGRLIEEGVSEGELPVERLTAQDVHMAEEYLRREKQLPPSTSRAIGHRIARALVKRMQISPGRLEAAAPRDLIRRIVQASRDREQG